jgi:hypothetical protein
MDPTWRVQARFANTPSTPLQPRAPHLAMSEWERTDYSQRILSGEIFRHALAMRAEPSESAVAVSGEWRQIREMALRC